MRSLLQPKPLACGIFVVALASAMVYTLAQSAPTTAPSTGPSNRVQRRAELTEEQYEQLAKELRETYSKPADQWPKPHVDADVKFVEIGLLPEVTFPEENPFTKEKAELGKQLFFDPRLSGSGQVSCASCHDPDLAWADGRTLSFGHDRQPGKRNAPTVMNAAHNHAQFWDGRAGTLESQAFFPVTTEVEMRSSPDVVAQRLNGVPEYKQAFKQVFGDENVTFSRVAQAIATFERTIVGGRSRFDAFLKGNRNALSDSAVRGLHLFRTEARCVNCHHGPNFTDNQFHDLGLSFYGRDLQDLGRYEVTKDPKDVGKFKTPTVRNAARTQPLMHNGLFDLDGVLNMYNAGMATLRRKPEQKDDPLFPTKSHLLRPLGLNRQDLEDLKAFVEALNEPRQRVRPPQLPGLTQPDDGKDGTAPEGD